jgi:hypothetical protein
MNACYGLQLLCCWHNLVNIQLRTGRKVYMRCLGPHVHFFFFLYMLRCKQSVCILKTYVHMLAYEVNLLWETPNIYLIKQYNSRCRMVLCADENRKVSFELIHWPRRNYGWGCIPRVVLSTWGHRKVYMRCLGASCSLLLFFIYVKM